MNRPSDSDSNPNCHLQEWDWNLIAYTSPSPVMYMSHKTHPFTPKLKRLKPTLRMVLPKQSSLSSSVENAVHGGGEVCPIACWDTSPREQTPPRRQTPPRADTPKTCWETSNKRAVRILLECNFVYMLIFGGKPKPVAVSRSTLVYAFWTARSVSIYLRHWSESRTRRGNSN